MRYLGFLTLAIFAIGLTHAATPNVLPNILIVTVDDMSADSLGCFGCKISDTSPNIDAFAKQSLKFNRAHVVVGNCMPGRNIMWSGLYSHVNGVEGFRQNTSPDYPVLCDLAKSAGYFAGIRGKVTHSTPYHPYVWDAVLDTDADGKKHHTKDIASYGVSTTDGIAMAKDAGKPFCLMVNISDPHKPFYGVAKNNADFVDPHVPTRVFTADEVPVPGFLPSDDVIRGELASYYSSVRRADDCFHAIMKALDDSGQADNTFVMFLSDHGMPLPFAKTQLYHHSTHTPLMIRWPSVTKPGSVDDNHMVSAVDLLPTLLDVMQHEHPTPERLHGRSFAPLLRGGSQKDRDFVILQYNENSGRNRHPMRGIQTDKFLYLYNPWSDGVRKFATATTGTATYRQMVKRAETETPVAARLQLFDHRVVEEFYDISGDADCLVNRLGSTEIADELDSMRNQLAKSLAEVNDPVAALLLDHENEELRESFMKAEDEMSKQARANKQKKSKPKKKGMKLFTIDQPSDVKKNAAVTFSIHHDIPKRLAEQQLHVTLKDGDGNRLERKIVSASGKGTAKVTFDVPDVSAVQASVFIGSDYQSSLQHVTTPSTQTD